jgi:cyclic di-GMP phosphodiesterase
MSEQILKNNHIVVANGLGAQGRPIERILTEDGYQHVSYVAGGREVIALCTNMWVDLLLLDLAMPDMSGFEVLDQLGPAMRKGRLQVIVVSAQGDGRDRYRALAAGVRDFISEPVDPVEVRLRVQNALVTSALEAELIARNAQLSESVATRSEELTRARAEVLAHLAVAAEFRDDETGEHTARVGRTSAAVASAHGLDPEFVRMIAVAAPLHDIGKIGVPDRILLKRGLLTDEERRVMQSHAEIGAAILADSEVPELRLAETVARSHHERWDGRGYPHGLAGVSIPVAARIVAIADVFDALVFPRPYKEAWTVGEAVSEIRAQRGRQFDANLVDAFLRLDHERLRAPVDASGDGVRRRTLAHALAAPPRRRRHAPHQSNSAAAAR